MAGGRLVLLALSLSLALAQDDELQQFMDKAVQDYKMLGVSLGVFDAAGNWTMRGRVGVRHAEDRTPLGENDRFALSDAGRSITAMVAARLVDQGIIQWNTTITEIFGTDVAEYMAKKTLLDLLVHDAGIPDYNQMMATERTMDWYDSVWNASQFSDPEENTRQRLSMLARPLLSPGVCEEIGKCKGGVYSHFTYSVAAAMMEMVTGKTWDALLQAEVFQPLAAPDCGLGPTTLDASLPPAQPWSHFCGPWGVYDIPVVPGPQSGSPSLTAPDDGVHCSLESWKNILAPHIRREETYLSPAQWAVLQTPQYPFGDYGPQYAPGFLVDRDQEEDITLLQHPGSDQKSYAQVYVEISSLKKGVVMVANSNMQEGMRQQVGWGKILEWVGDKINPEGKKSGRPNLFKRIPLNF